VLVFGVLASCGGSGEVVVKIVVGVDVSCHLFRAGSGSSESLVLSRGVADHCLSVSLLFTQAAVSRVC